MAYVYQQQPLPSNFTGVPVTINVVDANGNFRTIGSATTDATGTYSFQWTPDIPGKYTVIASFDGSNGYWPSSSETSFAVDSVAHPSPTATSTAQPAYEATTQMYIALSAVAVIIVLIIIGALIMLNLRRRPKL